MATEEITIPKKQKFFRLASFFLLGSSAMLWISGRMVWLQVTINDDKTGQQFKDLIGSVWDPVLSPVSLALIAGIILSLVMPIGVRRVLGLLFAFLSVVAGYKAVYLLSSPLDAARAYELLTTGLASQRESHPEVISQWAEVVDMTVKPFPVILTIVASFLGIMAGVLMALNPGIKKSTNSKYETPGQRREKISESLAEKPDSGRILWDAMDIGLDPTVENSEQTTDLEQEPVGEDGVTSTPEKKKRAVEDQ